MMIIIVTACTIIDEIVCLFARPLVNIYESQDGLVIVNMTDYYMLMGPTTSIVDNDYHSGTVTACSEKGISICKAVRLFPIISDNTVKILL